MARGIKIYSREFSNSTQKPAGKESCCNQPWCWYNPRQDSLLVEYCQETYLHGLKFVAQPSRHLLERIFWLISFIVGVFIAGYLISDVWRKYQSSPVILAFNPLDLSISKIQFPAVTVCNVNKVQKDFATEIERRLQARPNTDQDQEDYYVMNSVCTSKPTFAKRIPEGKQVSFNQSNMKPPANASADYVADFLHRASQPCSEMVQRCSWSGKEFNCSERFFPVITELGICCSFNLMPLSLLLKFPVTFETKMSEKEQQELNSEKKKWKEISKLGLQPDDITSELNFPRRQYQAGQTHGLSILLFPDLDNYFCTASDSTGFRVAFHSAIETPHVTEFGMAVPPGADMYVEVYPEVTVTQPIVTKFAVSDRHCYVQGEKKLKYYNYYTRLNCIDECEADLHRQKCNCSWFYEPRDNSSVVCVPNEKTSSCSVFPEDDAILNEQCPHCLPLCTQIQFGIQSSLAGLLNHTNLWKSAEEIQSNSIPKWIGKPVTILNLYYGVDAVVPKQRQELYGSTDLFANTGGLLGLCLGFSGLSAVEILYFCTIRLWFRKKGGSKKFRKNLMWNFSKAYIWMTGSKGQRSKDCYNRTLTLDKSKIPFCGQPLSSISEHVNHIQVKSKTGTMKTDFNSRNIYDGKH